jgi:hypothetical protein
MGKDVYTKLHPWRGDAPESLTVGAEENESYAQQRSKRLVEQRKLIATLKIQEKNNVKCKREKIKFTKKDNDNEKCVGLGNDSGSADNWGHGCRY